MASDAFTLLDNVTKVAADVDSSNFIYVSPEQNNDSGTTYSSIKVIIDYIDLVASGVGPSLTAVVEGRSSVGNNWFPLAYQFEPFPHQNFQQQREIILQPDLFWSDAGIDNIIYVEGTGTIAQISNQQGALSAYWRVSISVSDPNQNFTSIKVSAYGERYNTA